MNAVVPVCKYVGTQGVWPSCKASLLSMPANQWQFGLITHELGSVQENWL